MVKLSYFTNPDFPEIRGFPLLNHHLGFLVVWGRYNLTRFIVVRIAPKSFLQIKNPKIMFALEHLNAYHVLYAHMAASFWVCVLRKYLLWGLIRGILVHFSRRLLEEGHINNSVGWRLHFLSVPKKAQFRGYWGWLFVRYHDLIPGTPSTYPWVPL